MNVATSGSGGKNCGTEIRTAKKQKMQDKNGVTVLQNMEKWLVRKSKQTLGIETYQGNR